jgi:hypothetical protein
MVAEEPVVRSIQDDAPQVGMLYSAKGLATPRNIDFGSRDISTAHTFQLDHRSDNRQSKTHTGKTFDESILLKLHRMLNYSKRWTVSEILFYRREEWNRRSRSFLSAMRRLMGLPGLRLMLWQGIDRSDSPRSSCVI